MVIRVAGPFNVRRANNTMYLSDEVFCCHYNPTLIHQVLISFHSNFRKPCSSQKNRGSVKHSTRKLYKQKGSGRARAGMTSSPLRRGGGRTFPNSGNEVFEEKINKKAYKLSLRGVLSHLVKTSKLIVVNSSCLRLIKASTITDDALFTNELSQTLLVVDERELTKSLYLSTRNNYNVNLVTHEEINPRVLLLFTRVILTENSVLKVQELLQ